MNDEVRYNSSVVKKIEEVWGQSLVLFSEVINLAASSIEACGQWCSQANGLARLVTMGCACVRQTRAGLSLCRTGFADEAYSFCRPLWEKRVDIGFILRSGDAATMLERYEDWDRARLLKFGLENKQELDGHGLGVGERWGDVETELKEIRDKYAEDEQHSVGIGDGWAKLSCDLGEHREGQTLRSVEARAKVIGAHGADSQFRWLMFNGFVHLAPRAIQHGWSAPPGLTAAAFATPYGLHMPIQNLALTISMVASTFEDDLPDEVVPLAQRATMRQVGAERVEAFSRLLTTVGTVAAEFG